MSAPSRIRPRPIDAPPPPPPEKRAHTKLITTMTPREQYIYYYVLHQLEYMSEAALAYLNQQSEPGSIPLQILKGRHLERLNRLDEAIALYKAIIPSPLAYHRLAQLKYRMGQAGNIQEHLMPLTSHPFADFTAFFLFISCSNLNAIRLKAEKRPLDAMQQYGAGLEVINYLWGFLEESKEIPEMSTSLEKKWLTLVNAMLKLNIYRAEDFKDLHKFVPLDQKIPIPPKRILATKEDASFALCAIRRLLETEKTLTAYRLLRMNRSALYEMQEYWMLLGSAAEKIYLLDKPGNAAFFDTAEMAYKKVLGDDPNHPGARHCLAYLYLLVKKLDQAEETLLPLLDQGDKAYGVPLLAAIRATNSGGRRP